MQLARQNPRRHVRGCDIIRNANCRAHRGLQGQGAANLLGGHARRQAHRPEGHRGQRHGHVRPAGAACRPGPLLRAPRPARRVARGCRCARAPSSLQYRRACPAGAAARIWGPSASPSVPPAPPGTPPAPAPPPQGHQVTSCLVYDNARAMPRADCPFTPGRDAWWQEAVAAQPPQCPVVWVEAEHPLFLLYTSGSTGAPLLARRLAGPRLPRRALPPGWAAGLGRLVGRRAAAPCQRPGRLTGRCISGCAATQLDQASPAPLAPTLPLGSPPIHTHRHPPPPAPFPPLPHPGKPKGVLHTTGGYMVYAATTAKHVFNLGPGDTFWCTADCGWITGHSYLAYGLLLNGAANVVFEGVPTHPTPARCWQVRAPPHGASAACQHGACTATRPGRRPASRAAHAPATRPPRPCGTCLHLVPPPHPPLAGRAPAAPACPWCRRRTCPPPEGTQGSAPPPLTPPPPPPAAGDREVQGAAVLHGPHRHPLAHALGRRVGQGARQVLAAHPRLCGGAHQPRGLALVGGVASAAAGGSCARCKRWGLLAARVDSGRGEGRLAAAPAVVAAARQRRAPAGRARPRRPAHPSTAPSSSRPSPAPLPPSHHHRHRPAGTTRSWATAGAPWWTPGGRQRRAGT
jgi:hypothetical protein